MHKDNFNLQQRRKLLYQKKRKRELSFIIFLGLLTIFPVLFIIISVTNNNDKFIPTIYKKNTLVSNNKSFKVCIDAGHGDWDVGTVGVNGSKEKDIDLKIALKLGTLLNSQGIDVMYTRTTDTQDGILTANDSLKERLKISKIFNSTVFISIHCNSNLDKPEVAGIETWYKASDNESKRFAATFQTHLSKLDYSDNRGLKTYSSPQDALAVLEKNTATSALVELGFLSNKKDEYYLNSDIGQAACAKALCDAILEYRKYLENN